MHAKHVHFTEEEFLDRQRRARAALAERELDGLLLFKIEDMCWMCGLDTDGFYIFHALFLGADGKLTHVSRNSDLANLEYSSICDDIRVCPDGTNQSRSAAIKYMLRGHGLRGRRIGIQ